MRAGWEREQALLGFAPDTPDDEFSVGGLAGLATPPTVRICVLPGDLYTVAIPPQEPATVIPQLITVPCGWQLPHRGTVRGTSRGYVAVSQSGEKGPWRSFVAVAWHGGVDFFLGDQGGREWDAPPGSRRRLFYLQKVIGWAWAAFDLQREMVERFHSGRPFPSDRGGGSHVRGEPGHIWSGMGRAEEHGLLGPADRSRPARAAPTGPLPMARCRGRRDARAPVGARLDLAFGGPGERHLDRTGPDAGETQAAMVDESRAEMSRSECEGLHQLGDHRDGGPPCRGSAGGRSFGPHGDRR